MTKNIVYAKNNHVNKDKIFRAMSNLVKDQISSELDTQFSHIPEFMKSGNKSAFS